jgi:hypothetical protein
MPAINGVSRRRLLDQAGWRISARLVVPPNINFMPVPSRKPEPNPVESLWRFIRDNWLSDRMCSSPTATSSITPAPLDAKSSTSLGAS